MEDDSSSPTISHVIRGLEEDSEAYPSHAYFIPTLNYHCSKAELKRNIED